MRSDYKVWEKVLVRWGDMDALGHVNNARFFTYCESARIRYFAAVELGELEAERTGPSVVTATCNFPRQVRHPATLEVGVRATRVGNSSFTLEYGIFPEGEDDPVADGSSVVVWTDYRAGRSVPLPDTLRATLRDLDGV